MAQTAKAQEPSMEEILASIRRIIADDETKPAARVSEPPKPAAPSPPAPPRAAPPPPPPPRPAASPPRPVVVEPAVEPEPPPRSSHSAGADILDLTESMAAINPPPAPSGFRTIDGQPDVVFADPPPEPPEPPPPAVPDHSSVERLLSGAATQAVDAAFNSLAQTVLIQNARTLEDLVRDMLRPMLKSWLDDNLPGLVERLVRAEIERVSRGRS